MRQDIWRDLEVGSDMTFKRFIFSTVTGGLLIGASSAFGADMAVKARPMPVVAPFSWTGVYIGANVGGGWGTKDWTDPSRVLFLGRSDVSGWLAGGQVGANYQVGSVVFGVEAAGAWADINGSHLDITLPAPSDTLASKVKAVGSLTGRVGYAWDRVLLYVTGGGAWVQDRHSITAGNTGVTFATADNVTRWGWTIGAGLEYALNNNWSIKGEYQYMDFTNNSNTRFSCPLCITGDFNFNIDQKVNIAKIGVNYRFGASPVVAKY
jgi:outer membrane immunogenic protein